MKKIISSAFLVLFSLIAFSQSIELSNDFRLASPFHEPNGANDMVRLKGGDFVTIYKLKAVFLESLILQLNVMTGLL